MVDPALKRLHDNIAAVYMGNAAAIDRLIVCLLARGHVLIEDVPGVGKTVLAQSLARSIDCSFARIQCTPDLLPSDILGVSVYEPERGEFTFKRGPVFNSIIVADEINRTTPRTQSALLEAMSEGHVTADGRTYPVPQPFMVVATQNPYEFEGTYFLPENQLDRFLMRLSLGYPAPSDEARVIAQQPSLTTLSRLRPVLTGGEVIELQKKTDGVRLDAALIDYIIQLATATRRHDELQVGISPRGALALSQAARATAIVSGRDYCVPEDVVSNVLAVFVHRVIPRTLLHAADDATARRIVQQVLETVPGPV